MSGRKQCGPRECAEKFSKAIKDMAGEGLT
jgi:hypothetical protein